jgi:hypothetical protein
VISGWAAQAVMVATAFSLLLAVLPINYAWAVFFLSAGIIPFEATPVEVLERLLHLRPHVAFADAVAVDVACQLTGGVDDLAAAAHRHDVRVGRLPARHSDIHAFRLKPLDL